MSTKTKANVFKHEISNHYLKKIGKSPAVYEVAITDGAAVVEKGNL